MFLLSLAMSDLPNLHRSNSKLKFSSSKSSFFVQVLFQFMVRFPIFSSYVSPPVGTVIFPEFLTNAVFTLVKFASNLAVVFSYCFYGFGLNYLDIRGTKSTG